MSRRSRSADIPFVYMETECMASMYTVHDVEEFHCFHDCFFSIALCAYES